MPIKFMIVISSLACAVAVGGIGLMLSIQSYKIAAAGIPVLALNVVALIMGIRIWQHRSR